jgi:hypothetical protein
VRNAPAPCAACAEAYWAVPIDRQRVSHARTVTRSCGSISPMAALTSRDARAMRSPTIERLASTTKT